MIRLKKTVFIVVYLLATLGMIFMGCSTGGDDDGSPVVVPGQREIRTLSGVSVAFRFVPAGSFQRDSGAANVSVITRGYWMGETEVTQELFQAVMGINPSYFDGSSGGSPAKDTPAGETQNRRPVERVKWNAAIAFCNKLSLANGKDPVYSVSGVNWETLTYDDIPASDNAAWNDATMNITKNGYRLPTEMEWMWAAMGADRTSQLNTTGYSKAFAGSTGSNNVDAYAWYDDNSGSKTHETGKKAANELGLKDMSGNVEEWCWDLNDHYYPTGEQTDYTGTALDTYYRVERGGRWDLVASRCMVADRGSGDPYGWDFGVGFRVVCP
jgi:formylglycine-generating enzyme required for sulfatase activity